MTTLEDVEAAASALAEAMAAEADARRHRDEMILAADARREPDGSRTYEVNAIAEAAGVTREVVRQMRLPPEQKAATRRAGRKAAATSDRRRRT